MSKPAIPPSLPHSPHTPGSYNHPGFPSHRRRRYFLRRRTQRGPATVFWIPEGSSSPVLRMVKRTDLWYRCDSTTLRHVKKTCLKRCLTSSTCFFFLFLWFLCFLSFCVYPFFCSYFSFLFFGGVSQFPVPCVSVSFHCNVTISLEDFLIVTKFVYHHFPCYRLRCLLDKKVRAKIRPASGEEEGEPGYNGSGRVGLNNVQMNYAEVC